MRIIVLVKNEDEKYRPNDRLMLVSLLRSRITELNGVNLIDVRVASSHIEFDMFINPTFVNMALILDFLDSNVGSVLEVKHVNDKNDELYSSDETLKQAIRLFNEERFWEFHEALEPLWRRATGDEKELLHALILVAAAFVNYQKHKVDRAFSIFERALTKLPKNQRVYCGINVAELKHRVEEILASGIVKPFKLPND